MRFGQNTAQATVTVCVTLLAAFLVTGFASSAYHREQRALGEQHYRRGQALQARGQLDPALEQYRQALIFTPMNTDYRLSLATALLDTGRLDEAQSHLEQLAQENPTSGRINLLLGRVALQEHKLPLAVDFYQRGVYEYWPESDLPLRRQARWQLATLLSETGDRSGFIAELMQLYTNLPLTATADKLRVGYSLQASGATSEAQRVFQDLAKQAPNNPQVHRGLGEVNFSSGQYLTARHEFQKALHLDSKDQASAQGLTRTNEMIEMDPAMPYISAAEQLRRSRNLLTRVLKDLELCNPGGMDAVTAAAAANSSKAQAPGGPPPGTPPPVDPYQEKLLDAKALLAANQKEADLAFTMQKTAGQLWADKAHFCKLAPAQDHTLDTLFARIGQ